MLTVITNPSDHNFSRSPVICEIETDNMLVSGDFGDKAKFVFYIPPNPIEGNEFKVANNEPIGLWLIFTAFTNPVKWTIPLRIAGATDFQFYTAVLARINLSTTIFARYVVTYIGSGGFLFESILPGNIYSALGCAVSGTGFSFTNLLNGTTNMLTNVPRPNYKIGIDVYVERAIGWPTNVMDKIYSADKEPLNSKVKFDLSKIIDTQLEYYFPLEQQSFSNICRQTSKHFQVVMREIYGSPAIEHVTSATPNTALASPGLPITFEAFILKAGLSPKWSRVLPSNQLDAYVWSYPLLLSVFSIHKKIKFRQPEYIYYCFAATCINPVLKVTTYYADGSTVDAYQSLFSGTMYKGFVGCFPVNFDSSVLYNEMLTGNAVKFTVGICSNLDHSILIAGGGTYIPDYTEIGDDKIFLFTNSMSGVDTFRTEGNYIKDIEFQNENSSRLYYTSDLPHLGTEVNTQQQKTNTFKAYSGWVTEDVLICMEEFFLSKYKVEVEDFIFYSPITITSKKINVHETNEFLFRFEFEYYHQYKSSVTDKLSAGL